MLKNQNNKNKTNETKSLVNNQQGSGTEYHQEHAGDVEGYGQTYPVNGIGDMAKNND